MKSAFQKNRESKTFTVLKGGLILHRCTLHVLIWFLCLVQMSQQPMRRQFSTLQKKLMMTCWPAHLQHTPPKTCSPSYTGMNVHSGTQGKYKHRLWYKLWFCSRCLSPEMTVRQFWQLKKTQNIFTAIMLSTITELAWCLFITRSIWSDKVHIVLLKRREVRGVEGSLATTTYTVGYCTTSGSLFCPFFLLSYSVSHTHLWTEPHIQKRKKAGL